MRIRHHVPTSISQSRHRYDPEFALVLSETATLTKKSHFGPSASMSGAGPQRLQAGLAQHNDVVDAEFEIISDAPVASLGKKYQPKNWSANPALMRKSLNMRMPDKTHEARFFEQSEQKSWFPWSGEPLSTPAFYILAIAIMVISFWVSGGHTVFVSQKPDRPVSINTQNLPLDVRNVEWDIRYRATKPILFVSGNVYNPHARANPPRDLVVLAKYKDGKQEKLFIKGHKQPLAGYADYQFHGQLDLKHSEIASVSIELQKP